ncbi:hypothetical protein [Streptomyces sp. NBC_00239]|nr:hypothetical protein [Streptomyces sp. NBC_00239]
MGRWQSVDFEVYEHLLEKQQATGPKGGPPAAVRAGERRGDRADGTDGT